MEICFYLLSILCKRDVCDGSGYDVNSDVVGVLICRDQEEALAFWVVALDHPHQYLAIVERDLGLPALHLFSLIEMLLSFMARVPLEIFHEENCFQFNYHHLGTRVGGAGPDVEHRLVGSKIG